MVFLIYCFNFNYIEKIKFMLDFNEEKITYGISNEVIFRLLWWFRLSGIYNMRKGDLNLLCSNKFIYPFNPVRIYTNGFTKFNLFI